ncbi:hypothetical protein [Mycolicibacterium brisbanense]|uniref:Uncharacterized protein n=1 Tax=Mycolicibacterium brisbanense TaxID=146020 RepID=A0A117I606_9MYCO|nr:hypothetical protein [Mycolicibacterium brisbanense]MCV7161871.1 hypothetical protein [Mycolicibacterium brisbanense]GAS89385.1 uncharacterized protein RMCB_3481 [Mycolicibacterium brisbanense]
MTAEAIVMNRSAVALAADSAVTIGRADRPGRSKTYEGANKLFELIKGSNIGVMVYNSAEVNSTPWETIIKAYRQENPGFTASHVPDYADHFLGYIATHNDLLRPDDEIATALQLSASQITASVISQLVYWPQQLVRNNGTIIRKHMKEALNAITDYWAEAIDNSTDLDISDTAKAAISADFKESTLTIVEKLLESNSITSTINQRKRLRDIAIKALTKDVHRNSGSGLVVAGFGTRDYFPTMVSLDITARFRGELLTSNGVLKSITAAKPGIWDTFAQDSPAKGWVHGITDEVRTAVVTEWMDWSASEVPTQAREKLKAAGFTGDDIEKAAKIFEEMANNQIGQFGQSMNTLEEENFRKPMRASVAMLPKDELGLLAESLVNLTSLRQRMSIHQQNTVGGAIDVALISIGDGFVWLNRKHYFDNALNPTWHLTHGASIRTSDTTTKEPENAQA